MQTQKLPYELLVRWGQDGQIQGAHVVWAYLVTDDGQMVSYQAGQAQPAGQGSAGFPLSSAVNEALAKGLEANEMLRERCAQLEARLTEYEKQQTAQA